MALSQWDTKLLTPEQQEQVNYWQGQWGVDPAQNESIHAMVEQIRATAGYSGGVDGSQYIPIDTFNPPEVPNIPEYDGADNQAYLNTILNMANKEYDNPYGDLINQQLSLIFNRPKFDYNPDEDAAYQAFRERALRAGDKAYADNLGGLSAMTGGRPNSWAGTVASQARNQYALQAEEAALQFEDRAYGRYRDETQDMYNLLNVLNTQDEVAYSRYRDKIGDTKDLANLVLQLDERDFERYKYASENQWRTFETEYSMFMDSLKDRNNKISEAIDRTNLLGYVSNQDSIMLGVPAGTLSQAARERANALEDYIQKSKIDLENEFKVMEKSHKYDLSLIKARESSSSGGGSYSSSGNAGSINLTKTDGSDRDKLVNNFTKYTESDDFARLAPKDKYDYISNYIKKIVKDFEEGIYGKNGSWIADSALEEIANTNAYNKYYANYEKYTETWDNMLNDRYYNNPLWNNKGR